MILTPHPYLNRVCSMCKRVIGWVTCAEARAGGLTHTYCPPCAEPIKLQLLRMKAARECGEAK